jgi:hypothetical protein
MKMHGFIAAALFALAGCADGPAVPIEAAGDFTHAGSGYTFPPEVAGFRRISLARRDAHGSRVTVGYAGGTSQCPIAISYWIDPVEQPLDETAARARKEIEEAYPTAVLRSTASGRVMEWEAQRSLYDLDERRMQLILVARPRWYLKYRLMYPTSCTDEIAPRITQFLDAWRP